MPSNWTKDTGMSASRSMTLDMEAGMASYVGAAGVGALWGAGRDAAIAAAMDGAAAILWKPSMSERGCYELDSGGSKLIDPCPSPSSAPPNTEGHISGD